MPNLRSIIVGSVSLSVASGIVWLMATADGPWDHSGPSKSSSEPSRVSVDIPVGMDRKDLPAPDWVARSVTIGIREDERREGLTINHRVLTMRGVERPQRVIGTTASLVYTDASELKSRVNNVLDGTVSVRPGSEATFAIGRLVAARIVRLGADGRVRDVEDARVAFVNFTIDEPRGQH